MSIRQAAKLSPGYPCRNSFPLALTDVLPIDSNGGNPS